MSIATPAICVVTRGRGAQGSTERDLLLTRLHDAAAAGATMIQIRERQLDDRHLLRFIQDVKHACSGTGAAVVVNDRIDLALIAGADGVHLKGDAPSPSDVRELTPPGFLIGRSVHSVEEARDAASSAACDYLVFGTVFPSASKRDGHAVAGTDALAAVCNAVNVPVIAIGGIDVSRARDAAACGARGVAAISLFSEARDIAAVTDSVRRALTLSQRNV